MVDMIIDYRQHVEQYPVRSQVEPGYLKKLLPEEAPEKGEKFDAILEDVKVRGCCNNDWS